MHHGGWCWIWTARKSRSMENKSTVPTTGILNRPAITRCCCSTGRETVWERSCGPATDTVPRTGKKCFCRKSSANRDGGRRVVFRADAALAKPEIYEALEERDAIRLLANDNLL